MAKTAARIGFVAMAGLIGGSALYVLYGNPNDRYAACRGGAVAGDIGGPFTLVDETGATVTDKDVITKPTLIYFGYTFCPDVCPIDAARNAQAVDILEERGIAVTPVFITIDPARDTAEVLAEYTDSIHPAMIGLTGSDAQITAASQAYRTYFQKRETGDEYYLMDHSVQTYLVFPDTGFADFFSREATPDDIAQGVACFVGA